MAFAFASVLGPLAGSAYADGSVKPRSTVEVLDDKAQVDDVISRLSGTHAETPKPVELKTERPTPPELAVDKKSPAAEKHSPWKRPHHERGDGSNEHERPHVKHK
jgi:hypothetical protein